MALLVLLFVLWLIGIWIIVVILIGAALVYAAVLTARLAWAVGGFLIRFLAMLIDGPGRTTS